ncbi:MAG: roadblock/LC7 domain-containing protein [Candidatus Njordarchaeia archaeon]
MVFERIKNMLMKESDVKSLLQNEMQKMVKKEKNIKKVLLTSTDGLAIYHYGLGERDLNFFAVKISTLVSLVIRNSKFLGNTGNINYIQMELDNGSIIIALSKAFILASFTDEEAAIAIVKMVTKNALKKFEEMLSGGE